MVCPHPRRWAALFAALTVLLSALTLTPLAAHAANTLIVDDAVTSGANYFTYQGEWFPETSAADRYAGTEHWARQANNPSFTLTFTGEKVRLFGATDTAHGIYEITIDDGEPTRVDAYSPSRVHNALLYESPTLSKGQHVLTLTLTGEENPSAERADGQIDYAEVIADPVAVTGIEMDTTPLSLIPGTTAQLAARTVPADATNQKITFTSANPQVATVSATGLITAVATGKTQITATTADGDFEASVDVTVPTTPTALHGVVGSTDTHYVQAQTFPDYQRTYYSDVTKMTSQAWKHTAWRGDRVSGQFVLWTGSQAKTGVRVEKVGLSGPGGTKLGGKQIGVHFVSSVPAGRGRGSAGTPTEPIPEILGHDKRVAVDASSLQPIWMTIDVPAGTPDGKYTGSLVIVSDQKDRITFDLSLTVLNLRLPQPGEWTQFVDLWQNPYAVARAAGLNQSQLWSKQHFDVMRPHYQRLRDMGQDVITTTVVNDPWDSQTYDPYGSMVAWTKKADGSWAFDFSVFDRWVEFMMDDVGIDGQIDAYSMVNWASKIQYFDEQSGTTTTVTANPTNPDTVDTWKQMWGAFLDAFGPHLKKKGWFDRTYMAMDERPVDDLIMAADLIDQHAPGLKVAAAMNYNSLQDARLDRLAKISIDSGYVKIGDSQFNDVVERRRAQGLLTVIYYCTGDYPNTFARSLPAEAAWVQWKTLAAGSDGYLRWAYDSFVADPFSSVDYKFWESGDSAQLYPGNVSSVRWERMNEGVRDVEKARILMAASPQAATEIGAALAAMKNPGVQRISNSAVGTGDVDITAEVRRLEDVLNKVAAQTSVATPPISLELPGGTKLRPGTKAKAVLTDLQPGSKVTLELRSPKIALGTAVADTRGEVRLAFTVPTVKGSKHRLVATGLDRNGLAATAALGVTIAQAKPGPDGTSDDGTKDGRSGATGRDGEKSGSQLPLTGVIGAGVMAALGLALVAAGALLLRARRSAR